MDEEWPGFIIICYPEQTSEEKREKAIDQNLRLRIASQTDTMVTFSRACLYPSYEMNEDTIQAIDIGKVMRQGNAEQQDAKKTHQDFFYLIYRIKPSHTLNVHSFLKTCTPRKLEESGTERYLHGQIPSWDIFRSHLSIKQSAKGKLVSIVKFDFLS